MIYDYKLEELTQEVLLDCFCTLTDDIIDEYSSLRRYDHLSIYAPSNIAREILGRLLDEIEDLWVDADSRNELLYKDDNEVVITIACDGMVFVENAKWDGIILGNDDCCLTYFYDGLSKKDLDILEENAESILVFGFKEDKVDDCIMIDEEESECPFDCDGTECEDCTNKPEGTITIGDNGYEIKIKCNLDTEDALKVIESMEKRMEHVNDIFREMNEFRKLLNW